MIEFGPLHDHAVEFVFAVMASASTEKIKPIDWWTRARTAIEASGNAAADWADLLTRCAKKLVIDNYREESAARLDAVRVALDDFRAFADYLATQSIAVVADCQARKAAKRAAEPPAHWARKAEEDVL